MTKGKSAAVRGVKDILVMLLAAPGSTRKDYEPIVGRVRLMKMVFLFEEELLREFNQAKDADFKNAGFIAYLYGPYSPQVYNDLSFLEELDFVSSVPIQWEQQAEYEAKEYDKWLSDSAPLEIIAPIESIELRTIYIHQLTKLGIEYYENVIKSRLDQARLDALSRFKAWAQSLSVDDLLYYVYTKYPRLTEKSSIRNAVLSKGSKHVH